MNDWLIAWLFLNKWLIDWLFERTFFGIDVKHFLCRSIKNCLFCFCRDKFTVQMIYSVIFQFNDTDPVLRIRLNLIWTRSVPARKILFPVSLVLVLTEKCTRIKLFKKKYFHQQLLLNYVIKRPIPILFIKKDISMSPKNTHCLEILFFSCLLELL